MADNADVKFGEWIDRGFKLYQANFALLILSAFILVLVSVFSLGILAGPMIIGLSLMTLRLVDGEDSVPSPADIFQGFSKFLDGFLYVFILTIGLGVISLVLGIIPCLGMLLAIFASYAIGALVMFAPFKMAESNTSFWPACQESIEVVKASFWPFLGLYFVACLLGELGLVLCAVGIFLTLPLTFCILGVAYRDAYSGAETEVEPLADETNAFISAETQHATELPREEDPSEG
jgi:hypothetical protein